MRVSKLSSVVLLCVLGCFDEKAWDSGYDQDDYAAPSDEGDADTDADADTDWGSESEDDFLRLPPATTDAYVFVASPERDTVTRVSVPSLDVLTVAVGDNPALVATSADYAKAVCFSTGSDDLAVIDAESLDVVEVPLRSNLNALEMSPDGAWAVVYHDADIADEEYDDQGGAQSFNEISLVNAFLAARAEAEIAFGDSSVYVEHYIENPRHIEIQVLGDSEGNMIHLGERDCSLQRRHQKIIEESPSPVVSDELRETMGAAAVRLCLAAGYQNAGTVEFLVDNDLNFFFMEVNARIQVEHPVSEMVSGIDLVQAQIRIASGEALWLNQDEVSMKGHSIECRINAEDPDDNLRPCPGKIENYFQPGGRGVRVDSHVYSGYTVPAQYDSMIAKLIVHGETREQAIQIIKRALDEYVITGVKTTIPLHREIVRHPQFAKGQFDTSFIENNFLDL